MVLVKLLNRSDNIIITRQGSSFFQRNHAPISYSWLNACFLGCSGEFFLQNGLFSGQNRPFSDCFFKKEASFRSRAPSFQQIEVSFLSGEVAFLSKEASLDSKETAVFPGEAAFPSKEASISTGEITFLPIATALIFKAISERRGAAKAGIILTLKSQKLWIDALEKFVEMKAQNQLRALMAFYDTPGLTYDSGVLYDDAIAPTTKGKKMAKVKLDFRNLPDSEVIQQCTNIKTAMTGNATFTTPTPTLTAFGTLITTAQTKLTASDNAQVASKQATSDKDSAIAALLAAASQLATYVDLTAAGDETKIMSAGMNVRAQRTPSATPSQVANLSVTAGDNAGELDLHWDPAQGAKSYEVHMSPDPVTSSSWNSKPSVTKSKTTVTDMSSGTRAWARVRAVNSAGQGAWSSPISKVVP